MLSDKIDKLAYWLVLIGGLNWLFVGLFGRDLVSSAFSFIPLLPRLIYLLVGVSAAYLTYRAWNNKMFG